VLLSLALCHQQLGDPTACLKCVGTLRQLGGPAGSACPPAAAALACPAATHPAVALLAFAASLDAGDAATAQGEALGIVASEASDRDACLGVAVELLEPRHGLAPDALRPSEPGGSCMEFTGRLSFALPRAGMPRCGCLQTATPNSLHASAPGPTSPRPTVLDLLLGRFPKDCDALAKVAAAALGPDGGAPGPDAGGAADGAAAALSQREAMVLELLEHAGCAGADGAPAGAAALHSVLCRRAAALFQGRRYAAAAEFYIAALPFVDEVGAWAPCKCCGAVLSAAVCTRPPQEARTQHHPRATLTPQAPAKAVLCRCLALCHMGLGGCGRAAEFVELSEEYDPHQVGRLHAVQRCKAPGLYSTHAHAPPPLAPTLARITRPHPLQSPPGPGRHQLHALQASTGRARRGRGGRRGGAHNGVPRLRAAHPPGLPCPRQACPASLQGSSHRCFVPACCAPVAPLLCSLTQARPHTAPLHTQMACQEALSVGAAPIARAALTQLHALLVARAAEREAAGADQGSGPEGNAADGDAAAPQREESAGAASARGMSGKGAAAGADARGPKGDDDLPEGTVLRCLVKLSLDEVVAALQPQQPKQCGEQPQGGGGGAGEGGDRAKALRAALVDLGQWLHLASQRMRALGLAAFIGSDEAHAGEHVAWFAAAAWNGGLDAAGAWAQLLGRVWGAWGQRRMGQLRQHRLAACLRSTPLTPSSPCSTLPARRSRVPVGHGPHERLRRAAGAAP
jgi:hypothetical protein